MTAERQQLRVLVLSENYPPDAGGMAQSCDRIVRGLRAHGLHVDVAHLSTRHVRAERIVQQGGRLWRCPVEEDSEHALNLAWSRLDRDASRPQVVLAFGGVLPLLAAPVFAAWWGVPLLVLLRGNDFDAGVFSLRRGWVLREALGRAAAIAVVSREAATRVGALYPGQPVHCIGNGIDVSDWQLHDFDRDEARRWRAGHVQDGRRVLGLFGHLKRKKGGVLLLDALRRGGLGGQVHVLVIGDVEPALREWLEAPDAPWQVTCLPFMDRYALLPWYAACDVVAIPSHYDGMPNVALEAAALGVPLLAARVGGLADLLPELEYPLGFSAGDPDSCARALRAAVQLPPAALSALGDALRQRVLDRHRDSDETRRYAALLQALLPAVGQVGADRPETVCSRHPSGRA